MKKIILAGVCFWGMEAYYQRLLGVEQTKVGYTDHEGKNPTYRDVCNSSGHVEALWVEYDESVISLDKLLEHYFRIVDPTTINRQGNDIGIQYRSGIYCFDETDLQKVKDYLAFKQKDYRKLITVQAKLASVFYDAEDYHQQYLVKNPTGYCHISLHQAKNEELKEIYRV